MPIAELFKLLAQTLPLYVQRLDLLLVVGVVLLMIFTQYQRIALVERRLFGFVKNKPGDQMGRALLFGAIGGVLATLIFVFLGISLNEVGIWYLWLLAVVLMFVHPRFLCFSYGAGILALSHLIFGVPRLDVAAVMALVAVLHLVEAVLIYINGAEGATPVYVRDGGGTVVGGFSLQKFWPLPFVALVGALVSPELLRMAQGVQMPDWWPIIRPTTGGFSGQEYAFALFPVVAALGYSDVALTCLPAVKARRTAWHLLAYSGGLLALAILSQRHVGFAFAAALYSPLVHEWVIQRARAFEMRGVPRFTGHETMVLDVHPRSPAARAGLIPGDVIVAINGIPVRTREDLAEAMQPWALEAHIDVENALTHERRTLYCNEKIPPLGTILVPNDNEGVYMELRNEPAWRRALRRLGRIWAARQARRM